MPEPIVINTTDRQGYAVGGSARQRTDQGYLKVPGRVARIGVQQYLAGEIAPAEGQPDPAGLRARPANEVVNVYRPPSEVFAAESLASYENADVTDDHPGDMVDAATYREHVRGNTTGPGRADGDYVEVDLLIKDQSAIDAVEAGKVELSAGYSNTYHYQPGTTDDGTPYEFIQKDIRINHIALVDRARAGNEARLFDAHPNQPEQTMSTITLDGKTVKVGDESTAQLIQSSLDASAEKMKEMEDRMQAAKDEYEAAKKEMDEVKAAKDAAEEERDKYKEEASDAAVAAKVKEANDAMTAARAITGDAGFTVDSIDPMAIKRAALAKTRDSIDWAAQSDDYVRAAWDIETARSADERTHDHAAASHAAVAGDVARLYSGDNGQMVGDAAYTNFLNGGTQ